MTGPPIIVPGGRVVIANNNRVADPTGQQYIEIQPYDPAQVDIRDNHFEES